MAFKLKFQGKGKNPYSNIVSKGLVTPAHLIGGPGDEKKQQEVNKQAEDNVVFDPSTRTEVESDKPGYKKYRTTGKGSAEGYIVGTEKMSNEDWKKWLQTEEGKKYTASKNREKFDYVKEPSTTSQPDPKPKMKAKPEQMGLYDFLKSKTFDVPLDLNKTVVKEQQSYRGGPIREYYAKERMSEQEIMDYLNSLGDEGGKILSQYRQASKTDPGDGIYSQYSSTGDNQTIKNLVEERNQKINE